MYSYKSDLKLFKDYFNVLKQNFIDKYKLNKCKKINSFSETILIPEGAKYIGSEYLGQRKIGNYLSTIYKINREAEGDCFYTSYVYRKNFTQVLITDSWSQLIELHKKIDKINSPLIVEVEGLINQKGGIKNDKKTKFGRKRF